MFVQNLIEKLDFHVIKAPVFKNPLNVRYVTSSVSFIRCISALVVEPSCGFPRCKMTATDSLKRINNAILFPVDQNQNSTYSIVKMVYLL